jgi:hypothetical protein
MGLRLDTLTSGETGFLSTDQRQNESD